MERRLINTYQDIAGNFVEYLRVYSSSLKTPEEPQARDAAEELIKVEKELIDFFDTMGRTVLEAQPRNQELKSMQDAFASLNSGRKYIQFALADYRNLRPLSARLNELSRRSHLPADVRNNIFLLKEILLRSIKISEKLTQIKDEERKGDPVSNWQDKLAKAGLKKED
jgi:hypothetical protein